MLRAGVGYSVNRDSRQAAVEATNAALVQAGLRQATGALYFATSAHGGAYPLVLRTVAAQAGTAEVAGCSASGVIACERELESGPAIAVLVFGGGALSAKRLFAPGLRGRAEEIGRELAQTARPELGRTNLLCLFPDTYNLEAEPLLASLAHELPRVALVGGGATEDGSIGETFQFCGDVVSSNAVSGMLLAGDFDLNLGASVACQPLGRCHRVTAARENVLIELDGRPAFEVFAEAIGPLAADLRRAGAFVFLGVPLDSGCERLERGRYLVRNILAASEERGVLAVAYRPQVGETLGLLLRDSERAREDLKLMLEETAAASGGNPAFGLYFDCIGRGSGLYGIPDHDTAYIRQSLGPIPLAGFFTGMEIGPIGNATWPLQYSGVLVLVSETQT